jgi:hypothetical protein
LALFLSPTAFSIGARHWYRAPVSNWRAAMQGSGAVVATRLDPDRPGAVAATPAVVTANDLVGFTVDRVPQRFLLDPFLARQFLARGALTVTIVVAVRVLVTLQPVLASQEVS